MCALWSIVSALCDPMDCSPSGSSVHETFQARVQEWVAISYSKESSQPSDWTYVSCISCIGSPTYRCRPLLQRWSLDPLPQEWVPDGGKCLWRDKYRPYRRPLHSRSRRWSAIQFLARYSFAHLTNRTGHRRCFHPLLPCCLEMYFLPVSLPFSQRMPFPFLILWNPTDPDRSGSISFGRFMLSL